MKPQNFFFIGIFLLSFFTVFSQDSISSKVNLSARQKTMRIELQIGGGGGFSSINTGLITDKKDTVKISAGGGGSFGILTAYKFNKNFEVSLAGFIQTSSLTPSVSNASGFFDRNVIEPVIKYLFYIKKNFSLGMGAGFHYGMKGILDLDASKIKGGAHNIYKYGNSSGATAIFEYRRLPSKHNFSYGFGLKYYGAKWNLKSISSDGKDIPLQYVSKEILDKIQMLDGSAIEAFLGLAYHF